LPARIAPVARRHHRAKLSFAFYLAIVALLFQVLPAAAQDSDKAAAPRAARVRLSPASLMPPLPFSGPQMVPQYKPEPVVEVAMALPAPSTAVQNVPVTASVAQADSTPAEQVAGPGSGTEVSLAEEKPAADFVLSRNSTAAGEGEKNEPQAAVAQDKLFQDVDQDDVDKRSTAFIPTAEFLDGLTPMATLPNEARWIRVDLSEQVVVIYEDGVAIRAFVVSTGRSVTPTVKGDFRIRTKVRAQTMSGGSTALGTYYNLANVQWVQYFYADYGFHGTYWHNNFGTPMSHGCINMTNADAKWLFDWAGPEWDNKSTWYNASKDNPGTLVIVHE
jgi:lipoprotein-anchoring transpeptidase ErfK/SrfK